MFSARFNRENKNTELKFRAVCELLRARDLKILMVDAGAGDDFGRLTARYLQKLKHDNGIMLAVCTSDYAEMTASPYSSYAELVFAVDNHIDILPLRVEEIYPPQPPWGENHPFDKHGDAKGFVSMAMKSSVVFLDCRDKPEDTQTRPPKSMLLSVRHTTQKSWGAPPRISGRSKSRTKSERS